MSVRIFAVLAAFGFGWILLVLAGVELAAYETLLRTVNAPLAAFVRRAGLTGANDLVGFVVFLCYYYLLALVAAVGVVAVRMARSE